MGLVLSPGRCHAAEQLSPRATAPEACAPRAHAPQEKPPQWEAVRCSWKVAPSRRSQEKPAHSNRDPEQTKNNLANWCKRPSFQRISAFLLSFFLLFTPHGMWDCRAPPGVEPMPPAVEVWNLNYGPTRKVPPLSFGHAFLTKLNHF